ncbi:hypothetical protein QQZ08_007814 [Neonectria magnoliae]|uniref:ADF-H domain-containing protein n=1 Tax=Neonectria magnoliae TaxID=2732573 RepID=A0ABR1HWS9_9HYPO
MPLRLDNEPELREAQAALFNPNSQSGWLLLNYVGPSTLHFAAGGEGGPEEIVPLLEEDQVQYALVRVNVPGQGPESTARDVFVGYTGLEVGIIERGKKTVYYGDAKELLQPHHAEVTVRHKDQLNLETLIERSNPEASNKEI